MNDNRHACTDPACTYCAAAASGQRRKHARRRVSNVRAARRRTRNAQRRGRRAA